ncbi:MAG: methionyl-tRNA formyltransferase [Homoserinimonas sp.]|nr:methionyl-tRNA formyltransferase [Homoserinimonas sp.]
MTELRIVFAGSPEAAVPSLRAIAESRHKVVGVVTRSDSPQGRRRVMTPTAVAAASAQLGLETVKANRLDAGATASIDGFQADLGVIVAYGGLVREPLLSMPRLGWINLHFSLLPRWRGAAPVQRSLIAGDEFTGATVFQLVEELDAGDVFGQFTQAVEPRETAGELLMSLAEGGAELLLRVIDSIADETARAEPQEGDITLAPKLVLADGRIDFTQHATTVSNLIRGVTPEPGAFTSLDGARLKIIQASPLAPTHGVRLPPGHLALIDGRVLIGTGSQALELVTVHPFGKKAMRATDWWRGRPADAGRVVE